MKRLSRWLTSITMTIAILATLLVPAFATDITPYVEYSVSMQIVSYSQGGISSGIEGHTFLVFTNDGNAPVTIGHMPLAAGSSLSIGTFSNRSAHEGIWYNIEAYNANSISNLSTTVSAGYTLGQSALSTVNSAINSHDYWEITSPCSGFAKDVWNSIVPNSYQVSGINPLSLCASIKKVPNYVNGVYLPYRPESAVARHTSTSYVYDSSGV